MGNIIGNNPKKWAADQVNLRQQLLGLKQRTPDVLAWQNNKTAWIRAISAVAITSEKSKELVGSSEYSAGKLAKEFVLFNGTTSLNSETDGEGNITYTSQQRSGVVNTQNPSIINKSAYGFGGIDRGLQPMPGISSLDITTYNRGSLRRASMKLKAYNKEQFAALDALFMHPGYTLLIEWGHTIYFKGTPEKPEYTLANFNTPAFRILNEFLDKAEPEAKEPPKPDNSQQDILKAIVEERGNGQITEIPTGSKSGSEGNYDGFYGKIINFVWNYNSDGSYDIEVKAISTGDIVESLTINRTETPESSNSASPKNSSYFYFNLTDDNGRSYIRKVLDSRKKQYREYWDTIDANVHDNEFDSTTENLAEFRKYKASHPTTVNFYTLNRLSDALSPEQEGPNVLLAYKDRSELNKFLYKQYDYLKTNISKLGTDVKTTSLPSSPTIKTLNTFGSKEGDYEGLLMVQPLVTRDIIDGTSGDVKGQTTRLSENAPYQYIKFKNLLNFIQTKLLIYNGDVENPIIEFDTDGDIYCYTQPGHFSADPNVCVIPFTFPQTAPGEPVSYWDKVINRPGTSFKVEGSDYVGNLLNIPVNLHFIGSIAKQCTQNNALPLLKFLEQLLYGIQESLGSINKFSVTYNHDSNQIVLRDDVPLDPKIATGTIVPPQERTLFNVNGYKPLQQNGSFVSNVGISTTLSNQFATMISIAAQSRSSSDIQNSTSFWRWNVGLIDSVSPSKLSAKAIESDKTASKTPEELFQNNIASLNKPEAIISGFYKSKKAPSGDVISTSRSLNAVYNQYKSTAIPKEKNIPSTQGFIPFSMNLDMDGFSGLRIYEKFYITTEILPPSYPSTLSFLCKGISHSISTSGWKTKIDSLTVTNVDPENDEVLNTPDNVLPKVNNYTIATNL